VNDETDEPLLANHRNLHKVEKWTRDRQRVERMLCAGNSLDRVPAGEIPGRTSDERIV
jgi:hypothetical protein